MDSSGLESLVLAGAGSMTPEWSTSAVRWAYVPAPRAPKSATAAAGCQAGKAGGSHSTRAHHRRRPTHLVPLATAHIELRASNTSDEGSGISRLPRRAGSTCRAATGGREHYKYSGLWAWPRLEPQDVLLEQRRGAVDQLRGSSN
jgi:hypothetical protein